MDALPNIFDLETSTKENSIDACNSSISNATNCADYRECFSQAIDRTQEPFGPICCTAYDGCLQAPNISATIPINSTQFVYDTAIRCDGFDSCTYVTNNITSKTNFNGSFGHIYFTAAAAAGQSAAPSTIVFDLTSSPVAIQLNSKYNIYCTGWISCRYRNIDNVNNLYCLARYTCQDVTAENIGGNIYAYGTNAGVHMEINNLEGNVYCSPYRSCFNAEMSNVTGYVHGEGYQVLYAAVITNVDNDIIGMGFESLYEATIENVNKVSGHITHIACVVLKNVFNCGVWIEKNQQQTTKHK